MNQSRKRLCAHYHACVCACACARVLAGLRECTVNVCVCARARVSAVCVCLARSLSRSLSLFLSLSRALSLPVCLSASLSLPLSEVCVCLSVCVCVCLCVCVCVCASSRALWRHPSAGTCRLIKGSASPARLWMKVGSVPANLFLLLAAEFVVLLVGVFAILSVLRGHLRPHAAHHNVWVGVGGCGWAWVMCGCIHTYILQTYIRTHIRTYMHTYIHTHTCYTHVTGHSLIWKKGLH